MDTKKPVESTNRGYWKDAGVDAAVDEINKLIGERAALAESHASLSAEVAKLKERVEELEEAGNALAIACKEFERPESLYGPLRDFFKRTSPGDK